MEFLLVFCSLIRTFAPAKAQMAESVDALVSNTSGATHPGSSPGLGTRRRGNTLRLYIYNKVYTSSAFVSHSFYRPTEPVAAYNNLWRKYTLFHEKH